MAGLLCFGHNFRVARYTPELSAAVLARRSTAVLEAVIGAVHQHEANRLSAAAHLAFFTLAPLRSRVSSDNIAEVDAIRMLPASLPINILAFLLGCQVYRGFLFWAVFAAVQRHF